MEVLIEPLVGGQFSGAMKSTDTGNFTALVYGGRIGLDFHEFQLGGEYLGDNNMNASIGGPNSWGSGATSITLSNANYGGFLAVEMMQPLALRLIGTFFAVSEAKFTHRTAGSTDADQTLKGYGYKAEISTRLSHYVDLGVAYYYLVYPKSTDNLNGTTSTLVPVGNQHAVMVHLSFPLEF
jgi:hypothetical protein